MFAETRSPTFDEGPVRDKEKQYVFVKAITPSSRLDACLYVRHVRRETDGED